jgi:hypothetical protein
MSLLYNFSRESGENGNIFSGEMGSAFGDNASLELPPPRAAKFTL